LISIRPIAAHEWHQYREIRLRALQDAPQAFGSTWEQETAWADDIWCSRTAAAASGKAGRGFFAVQEGEVCGLLWCQRSTEEAGVAHLYQMWVDPAVRGMGAGRRLLTQALDWARGQGVRQVRLAVTVADSPALHLYRSLGFRAAGPLAALREGCDLRVQAMVLEWPGGAAR